MSKIDGKRKPRKFTKEEPIRANVEAGAVEQLVEEARKALPASEAEEIARLVDKFTSAPRDVAIEAIRRIGRDLREQGLPVLEALANSGDREIALAAIQALGATRTEKAVVMLATIAETSENKEVQKEARRSLFKLKSMGIAVQAGIKPMAAEPPTARPTVNLFQAFMTNYDGHGDQALQAAAEGPFGRLDAFLLIINDSSGIEKFDGYDSSKKSWRKLVQKTDEIWGFSVVEIPVDYFRYKVKQAYELTKSKGNPIPSGFDRWRSLIARPEQTYERHPIYGDISVVEIKWNPELLEQSPQILKNEEFMGWLLPEKEVAEYIKELVAIKEGKVALPPWVEVEKAQEILDRALEHFFDAEMRTRYRPRLEDAAYLLFHTDRQLDAKRALAAAVAFDNETGVPSPKHPFARGLLRLTIEVLLTEQEEAEKPGRERLITDISEIAEYLGQTGREQE